MIDTRSRADARGSARANYDGAHVHGALRHRARPIPARRCAERLAVAGRASASTYRTLTHPDATARRPARRRAWAASRARSRSDTGRQSIGRARRPSVTDGRLKAPCAAVRYGKSQHLRTHSRGTRTVLRPAGGDAGEKQSRKTSSYGMVPPVVSTWAMAIVECSVWWAVCPRGAWGL